MPADLLLPGDVEVHARDGCWKSLPQPMNVSPGGKFVAPPLIAVSGLRSVNAAGGALTSTSGVNGGASTPFWKKSPWPASAS